MTAVDINLPFGYLLPGTRGRGFAGPSWGRRSGMALADMGYLAETVRSLVKNREFIRETVLHEFRTRNRGSALGSLWLVLRPLVETAAYVAVISLLLRAALPSTGGAFDYAVYVLSGIISWQILTKTLAEAPPLIPARMDMASPSIDP